MQKILVRVDSLRGVSIVKLCLEDHPSGHESMKNNEEWLRDFNYRGLDWYAGYRTEYLEKDMKTIIAITTRGYVPVIYAYLSKNKDKILASYFSEFLISYFEKHFVIQGLKKLS